MAIYHLNAHNITRSDGTATAAAAYRAGEVIKAARNGQTSDYRRKAWQVVHSEIDLPAHAPTAYYDRSTLWNAVEAVENKANSRQAKEVEFALAVEWSRTQQIEIVREFVRSTFVSKGMCADWSIHDKGDGNPHCHCLLTTREINPDGTWAFKQKTVYKLDENGDRIPVIDPATGQQKIGARGRKMWQRETVERTPWDADGVIEQWRKEWADTANRYLEPEQQISHESYEKQGIDKEPTRHEGYAARAMEAKGEVADRCEYNRGVKERNNLKETLKERAKELIDEFKEALDGYVQYFKDGLERLRELKRTHEQEPVVPVQLIEPDFDDYDYQEDYDDDVPFTDEEIAAIWKDYLASADESERVLHYVEDPEEPDNKPELEGYKAVKTEPIIDLEDDYHPKTAKNEPDQRLSDQFRWGIAHEPIQNDVLEPISDIENRQDSPKTAKNEPDLSTYRPATPVYPSSRATYKRPVYEPEPAHEEDEQEQDLGPEL